MEIEKDNLQKFVIGMVIVGLTLVIGIYIASTMSSTFDVNTVTTATVANQTGGYINATGYVLPASLTARDYTNPQIVAILNASNNAPILVGNYTLTGSTITNATTVNWGSVKVTYNYSYTYDAATASSNASDLLVGALSGGSAWVTILIVIGFAVIVLGLLSEGLGKASQGNRIGQPTY